MNELIQQSLNAYRRRWLQRQPVYRPACSVTAEQLAAVEALHLCRLPAQLRQWLLQVGCGSFNNHLQLHPPALMTLVEQPGPLQGYLEIASDNDGNGYVVAADGSDPAIWLLGCRPHQAGPVAADFAALVTMQLPSRWRGSQSAAPMMQGEAALWHGSATPSP